MHSASPRLLEGAARFDPGQGFFNPSSRPSRDLGVLLARTLRQNRPLRVLDLMAGCGIRSLRYALEAQARNLWANDGDAARLPLLHKNLSALDDHCAVRRTALSAQRLLADCLGRGERFDLVDLDAFGSPHALIPLALEAVAFGGILYLATTDGRGPTGHDRGAALRRLGASARSHPSSWEQALRLQIGVVARSAWSQGRGLEPVVSFSDGRSFRTALRLRRHPRPLEEGALGLTAICHGCGDQQVQSLLTLKRWRACSCPGEGGGALAVSGPLWIGPLQHLSTLEAMAVEAATQPLTLSRDGARLLERLRGDRGWPAPTWPHALLARHLAGPPPPLKALVERLRQEGFAAVSSGVMPGHFRSDAPWPSILALATELAGGPAR
ncbi:MAG: N2,N2-dimethylguanosine tRNA methyltransferase [Cyanobacteriota bacterium]|nr:N2,N2-dimethylguanosine tRNA methyltransferase [Cyanobacteriota bacterium]